MRKALLEEAFRPIGAFVEGPVGMIALQPFADLLPRQVEKDGYASRPMNEVAVRLATEGPAARRHHHTVGFHPAGQLGALCRPERRLAANGEDLRYRSALSPDDLLVEIDQSKAEAVCHNSPDRAFTDAHEADQEHTPHLIHGITEGTDVETRKPHNGKKLGAFSLMLRSFFREESFHEVGVDATGYEILGFEDPLVQRD